MMKELLTEISMQGLTISKAVRDYNFSMDNKHFHDCYELYYLIEGERYYFIDKEIFHVKAGSLVLINREQIHKTSMAESSYHSRMLLQMNAGVFRPFFLALGLPDPDDLIATHYGVIDLKEEDQVKVLSIFDAIMDEIQKKKDRYELLVKLRTAELFLIICRYCKEQIHREQVLQWKTEKHSKVQEVVQYLSEHCETDETLEKIAARFFISKSYLSRIFKEVTGFTVNEYINLVRIKKAKRLLKNSHYSITELSAILGFESLTYFERVFKKLTGLSPKRYQKSYDQEAT
jgi:AraC-like DNA-binding protein